MFLKILLIFVLCLPLFSQDKSNDAVVFVYHRFGETKYPSTSIKLEQFKFQLDYLKEHNYNVVKLSKLVSLVLQKKPIPPKTVCITVDDAYKSVYTNAYPMMKKRGFNFSVFVSTKAIDNCSKSYMSWEQMIRMKENGVEFANHSLTHPYILQKKDQTKQEWEKRFSDEVLKAQIRLQEELGADTNSDIKLYSYPFGEYDSQTIELLKKLGYFGVTQTSGAFSKDSDLMRIYRYPMAEVYATKSGFLTKLNTMVMPVKSFSPQDGTIKNQNPPKLHVALKNPLKGLRCYMSSGDRLDVKWINDTEFEIEAREPLKQRRQKYTCTAPAPEKKWYWFSFLWINP